MDNTENVIELENLNWKDEYHVLHNTLSKNKNCVIMIPIYKQAPNIFEKMSLKQVCAVIENAYEICFVAPKSLNVRFNEYEKTVPNFKFSYLFLDDEWFKSVKTYAKLCITPDFYRCFEDYKYMLIYQLDAWINKNTIQEFINLDYDYYGGIIYFKDDCLHLQNGGFCLRKIQKCIEVLEKYKPTNENLTPNGTEEDVFFCELEEINVAPPQIAMLFGTSYGVYPEYPAMGHHFFGIHPSITQPALNQAKFAI